MFYVLMIPIFILSTWMIFNLRSLERHDRVLFMFCQIRRDAMKYLRDEGLNISESDYKYIRHLVDVLNVTINNYKKHKTSLFNYRLFKEYIKQYERSAKNVTKIKMEECDNEVIREIFDKTRHALLCGFLTYTPLLKSEIVIRFLILLMKGLGKIGVKHAKYYTVRLIHVFDLIKNENYCHDDHNCCTL